METSIKRNYSSEFEGRTDFLNTYLPRVDKNLDSKSINEDYSDGVVNGTILEFKLVINDLNRTLFQVIKYLSSMRIKGKSVPANIVLISLNTNDAYLYKSENYLSDIEKVYSGASSKGNDGFIGGNTFNKLDLDNLNEQEVLVQLLRKKEYIKIHIDENCIVGWAERFYKENPTATKSDFIGDLTGKVKIIGEIRNPDKFKDLIYPYDGENNEKFRYLMDKLNDNLKKKDLGAFYTHKLYAAKALELVKKAIARVPKGNDYVIIDRCAGTGNLESVMDDDMLSHCIVSTIEYYEYKVLMETIGDKVRHVIPPTEKDDTFNMGLVRGADALSEEYVKKNPIIQQYVDDDKCTIILFENPPYSEATSVEHQKRNSGKKSSEWKQGFVPVEMAKEIKGTAKNELSNAFIWSAFKYYIRKETDSYIVFSPVKYWKSQHLINQEFIDGYAFNRRHFHTNIDACIMCALWSGKKIDGLECFYIQPYDIYNDDIQESGNRIAVKRIHKLFSQRYYAQTPQKSIIREGVACSCDGTERDVNGNKRYEVNKIYFDGMIGYLVAKSCGFDNPDLQTTLTSVSKYDANGFFLIKDNFMDKLPMFAAGRYITYNRQFTERGFIMKSGDGADRFNRDVKNGKLKNFLQKCLLFTVLEPQNHMRSFKGSDGRNYVNQLCLDDHNGETLALKELKNMDMDESEKKIYGLMKTITVQAKKTVNYNPSLTYGLYQIKKELNTMYKDPKTGKNVPDYPEMNGNIKSLAALVKEYYNKEIVPTLFEYEFLK